MNFDAVMNAIRSARVVAVLRAPSAEGAVKACEAMQAGGMNIMEITTTTTGWEEAIKRVAALDGMTVGLGTAICPDQVTAAKDAGAVFVVSPGFDVDIADRCLDEGMPYFPGIATPTELMAARKHKSVAALKLFPAENLGGVKTMKAFRGPFPDVEFMPTGGVNSENAKEYLASGAIAVGMSAPCKGDLINGEKWDEITSIARDVVAAVS